MFNRWRYSNQFWHYCASPINGLLSYADSTSTWIRCDNNQVWLAFWNLFLCLRSFCADTPLWESLFQGRLGNLIPLPKRIVRLGETGQVIWATGDATLTHIAAVNWETKGLREKRPGVFYDLSHLPPTDIHW